MEGTATRPASSAASPPTSSGGYRPFIEPFEYTGPNGRVGRCAAIRVLHAERPVMSSERPSEADQRSFSH